MTNFIKGKWYTSHIWKGFYMKCNEFKNEDKPYVVLSEEQLHQGDYTTKSERYTSSLDSYKEVPISEIAKYLPKDYKDLETNVLTYLELY